jgi:MFS family permease
MEQVMSENIALTRARLKTPKAAAIAGIAFSVLLITIFWLLRRSVPADPLDPGMWLATESKTVALALNLVPFAGVAFLWFIGVLRDRLGEQEDRFFATVFLGSALLFLAMLFAAAAITGAVILVASSADPNEMINSPAFRYARATGYIFMNVYAIKMAAVFMISTSTVVIYTDIAPRWIAILGYVLACVLLVGSYYINLSFFVLPLWVFLVSIYILLDNLGRQPKAV